MAWKEPSETVATDSHDDGSSDSLPGYSTDDLRELEQALTRTGFRFGFGDDPASDERYLRRMLELAGDVDTTLYAVSELKGDAPRSLRNPRGYFTNYLKGIRRETDARREKDRFLEMPESGTGMLDIIGEAASSMRLDP